MKPNNKKFSNLKHGFTLAEVLITLVIIGVVAALTVPTAINRIQREELRSQFKKAVSVASQAVQKMKADYGDSIYQQGVGNATYNVFVQRFKSYFSVVCEGSTCIDKSKYKKLSKTSALSGLNSYFFDCFTTQDGMLFCFNRGGETKDMYVFIDVNGKKNPNILGYDTFGFYVNLENQILEPCLMWTCGNDGFSLNGAGCTAKAISDPDYFKNLP